MNLSDFLIIYLACGTPFGMYYFINHRKADSCFLKAILAAVVWIPYAVWLLRKKIPGNFSIFNFSKEHIFDSDQEERIEINKKHLEFFLMEKSKTFSHFEFREIADRYTGLSLAVNSENKNPTDKEHELISITDHENKTLAARCLYRRNLKLLAFHHTLARRDFLNFISERKEDISEVEKLYYLLFEFIRLLNDREAEKAVKSIFPSFPQSKKAAAVKQLETEIWKPDEQKQSPAKPITIHL